MTTQSKKKQRQTQGEKAGGSKDAALRSAEGYGKAIELLRACSTPEGFLASPTDKTNYRRIWARDGAILSLAALMTEDADLIDTAERTLRTLARYQGPHGEIPSNVDPTSERVSYGGTTGRVDADLWFIIGCGELWRRTDDDGFLEDMLPVIQKVRFLLGAWEFNNRGLLYIPQTGDWADEYVHNGYVLYDQLLYMQVHCTLCGIHRHIHDSIDHSLSERKTHLKHLIRANYWFTDGDELPDDVYHEVLYRKGREAAAERGGPYWMSFFAPHGYGFRFDALANVLVSLLDVADDEQRAQVDGYIRECILAEDAPRLLPAYHPVILPKDEHWTDLQMSFSHTFKNRPYEYQNGGLWPMVTGFHVADLARRGEREQAEAFLNGIHEANAMERDGEAWSFPEYVHGEKHTPGGTRHQGWSAAAAVIGTHALEGAAVFSC